MVVFVCWFNCQSFQAYSKAVKIHTTLPEGGILIFVTGQREVNHLLKKLRKAFPLKHFKKKDSQIDNKIESDQEEEADNGDNFDTSKWNLSILFYRLIVLNLYRKEKDQKAKNESCP